MRDERTDGADIDGVSGHLVVDGDLREDIDNRSIASLDHTQFAGSTDLVAETHAASADDAAISPDGDGGSRAIKAALKDASIQPESIDFGILEKTKNVCTVEADFQWNDLGSWYSLFSVITKNKHTSHHEGDVISVESENNLIISPNRLTAVVGIKDMAIINLDDATLIVPHDKSEAVKDVVNMLKTLNKSEYL